MILNEQVTPQDIAFFENLIKLEELTGKVYTDNIQPGSPMIQNISTTATSLLNTINNSFAGLSETGQNELKTNEELYGGIVGTNAATLQLLGDQVYAGAKGAITNFLGKLGEIGGLAPDEPAAEEEPASEEQGGDTEEEETAVGTASSQTGENETTPEEQEKQSQQAPSANTGEPTDEEKAAFQKAHATPYDPKSSMDRGKLQQMRQQAQLKQSTQKYLPPTNTNTASSTSKNPGIYFVRRGPNRYQPATDAELNSGEQLFVKNPNPVARAVYPYIKMQNATVKRATKA